MAASCCAKGAGIHGGTTPRTETARPSRAIARSTTISPVRSARTSGCPALSEAEHVPQTSSPAISSRRSGSFGLKSRSIAAWVAALMITDPGPRVGRVGRWCISPAPTLAARRRSAAGRLPGRQGGHFFAQSSHHRHDEPPSHHHRASRPRRLCRQPLDGQTSTRPQPLPSTRRGSTSLNHVNAFGKQNSSRQPNSSCRATT
jgi:hypothetical protein